MPDDAPLRDAEALVRHLREHVNQGDLFQGLPIELARTVEHYDHEPIEYVIVITQTCDVVKPPNQEPWVHVAAVIQCPPHRQAEWPNIAASTRPAYHPLTAGVPMGNWYVDFRSITPLDKWAFEDRQHIRRLTDHELLQFQKAVQRRFTRPAIADEIQDEVIAPIRDDLKKRKNRAARIERVLVREGNRPNEIQLCFLLPSDTHEDEELRTNIMQYCRTTMDRIEAKTRFTLRPPIYSVRTSMTLDEFESYQILDLDFLSPDV